MHIESFVMKYTNPLGFNVKDTFQYIFGLHKDATYYYLLCPQKQRPLYSELMDLYNETKNQPQNQNADSLTHKRWNRPLVHPGPYKRTVPADYAMPGAQKK